MRIGQLANRAGTTTKAIRYYEAEGVLPSPPRADNGYRDYGRPDLTRLRMLVALRSLDVPLERAAELATLCAAGHCDAVSADLRDVVVGRRADIAARLEELRLLDDRLATLERHLSAGDLPPRALREEGGIPMLHACDCSCGQCCGCDCCGCGCPCSSHSG